MTRAGPIGEFPEKFSELIRLNASRNGYGSTFIAFHLFSLIFSTFRPDSFSDHLVARLALVVKPTAARAGRGLTRRHFFFSPHHFPLFIFYFIISRLSASFRIHFHLISNFLLKNFKEIFSDLIARFFINLNEFVCFFLNLQKLF